MKRSLVLAGRFLVPLGVVLLGVPVLVFQSGCGNTSEAGKAAATSTDAKREAGKEAGKKGDAAVQAPPGKTKDGTAKGKDAAKDGTAKGKDKDKGKEVPDNELGGEDPKGDSINIAGENANQPGQIDPLNYRITNKNFYKFGGTDRSEAAVQAGLKWLAKHQASNGSWSLKNFNQVNKCTCTGGGTNNDIAGTAMAVLCFVAHGETHRGSEQIHDYTKVVDRAIKFLVSKQTPEGDFEGMAVMYVMGMATMALCEDYCNSGCDPVLTKPCQKAIDFIVRAQHSKKGGWRYRPNMQGDMSVTSWQIQAIKSAQLGGLKIPYETKENALKFVKALEYPSGDGFGYRAARDKNRPTMRAAGMLSRQYLVGGDLTKGPTTNGATKILGTMPSSDFRHMYHYYYATQALFNVQGKPWQTWNPKMQEYLLTMQDKGKIEGRAHQKGSWTPDRDVYGQRCGRVLITAFALLQLEVYYRHTPLNRPNLGSMKKDPVKK